jgi:hypothetical protein
MYSTALSTIPGNNVNVSILKRPDGWELTAVDGVGVLVGNLDTELLYWEPVVSVATSCYCRSMSLVIVGLSKQDGQTYLLNSHHDFHGV